jgi:chemotaxis-related protein WspD
MAAPEDDIKPDTPRTGESTGASGLLARPLPPGYRAEWARHIAAPRTHGDDTQAAAQVLIFRLGGEWLALPAGLVTEITEPRRSHSLPHRRDRLVRGIVNVRGELLVKVALEELLGVAPDAPGSGRGTGFARLVVIGDSPSRRVAFEADEVHGLHRCTEAELRPLPATIERAASRFTDALIDWQGHAVGRLDGPALLDALGRGLA